MKLHHLGESIESPKPVTETKQPRVKMTYKQLTFNSTQMPEVSELKPGQKVMLTIEAQVKSAGLGKDQWSDDKKGSHADFTLMFGACRPLRGKPKPEGKIRDFQDAAHAAAKELAEEQS
jgi:hypothetical protein